MPAAKPSWIHKKLKLSHRRHSFKRLPHKHTSNGLLVALTVIAGVFMFWTIKTYTLSADALTGSGFLGLTGQVKPTSAGSISSPVNKQIFNTKLIDVSGTCPTMPPGNIVKLVDNGFITTAPCSNEGIFKLKLDLFPGVNYLRTRISDIYNQNGPDSVPIKVFFYYPAGTKNVPSNMFNVSNESDLTIATGRTFKLKLKIMNGQPPYAFSIDWGDGTGDVVSRDNQNDFSSDHTYSAAGQRLILISASDKNGQKAFSQTVILVTGPGLAVAGPGQNTTIKPTYIDSAIKILLPTYAVLTFGVFSFWLGQVFSGVRVWRLPRIHLFRH